MPTMVNPFRGTDPTAQAIADLGTAMFGNSGAGELRRQAIIKAQRENVETDNTMKALMDDPEGLSHLASTSLGQAMLFGSGYDADKAASLGLMGTANKFGATDPRTNNAQIAAGQSYDNTSAAVTAKLAESARQANIIPVEGVGPDGKPTFASRGTYIDMPGFRPAESDTNYKGRMLGQNFDSLDKLDPLQQRSLGIADKQQTTPHSYLGKDGISYITYDGITDARTNAALPEGVLISPQGSVKDTAGFEPTTAVKGSLQSQIPSQNTFGAIADSMISLTDSHPEAFGAVGKITGGIQELAQAADVLVGQMGGKQALDNLLDRASANLQASGASPELLGHYNKAISAVDTLGPILAYQAASAIAQQSGRSVSDKEVELFTRIVGDPQGWLSSAPQVATKLKILKATVQYSADMAQEYLSKGLEVPDDIAAMALSKAINDIVGVDQPLVAPADPAAAPAATDQYVEGQTATGPGGAKMVFRNGDWVPL